MAWKLVPNDFGWPWEIPKTKQMVVVFHNPWLFARRGFTSPFCSFVGHVACRSLETWCGRRGWVRRGHQCLDPSTLRSLGARSQGSQKALVGRSCCLGFWLISTIALNWWWQHTYTYTHTHVTYHPKEWPSTSQRNLTWYDGVVPTDTLIRDGPHADYAVHPQGVTTARPSLLKSFLQQLELPCPVDPK